jgi:hypothetical protein
MKVGSAIIGLALAALAYNFFKMFSLAGKCPEDIEIQPCQAHDNWVLLNKVGLIILLMGVAILAIGLANRRHNKL